MLCKARFYNTQTQLENDPTPEGVLPGLQEAPQSLTDAEGAEGPGGA